MLKFGVFWKIQDICYQMSTEIFKIEDEMTVKMKPKVANPPFIDPLSHALGHYGP